MVPARSVATTTISHVPHPAAVAPGTRTKRRNASVHLGAKHRTPQGPDVEVDYAQQNQRGGRGKFCEHDAQIHGVYARLDDAHEHRTKRGVVGAQSCAPPTLKAQPSIGTSTPSD